MNRREGEKNIPFRSNPGLFQTGNHLKTIQRYIYILDAIFMRKNNIVILVASLVVLMGFLGLSYNLQHNSSNQDNYRHSVNYYLKSYDFKELSSLSSTRYTFDPFSTNESNDSASIHYTFFKGGQNITGTEVTIYIDGSLVHRSLLVNNSNRFADNLTIFTTYSKNNNYDIIHVSNVTGKNSSAFRNSYNGFSNAVYIDLQAYALSNGVGFNQQETVTLLTLMGMDAALGGLASVGILGALFALGTAVIGWYDAMGGYNGVSVVWGTYLFVPYVWINAPFDPSGSNVLYIETLFQGNIV